MANKPIEFEYLIDTLKSLPGVGYKGAMKWAYFLLEQDERYIETFVNRVQNTYTKIKKCSQCGNLTNKNLCDICTNVNREHTKLCIVTTIEDLQRIEDSKNYNGLYFVLGKEINPKLPDIEFKKLIVLYNHINNHHEIKEVIIATNFTIGGQLTAKRIIDLLDSCKVKIYRIGLGLPLNCAIDYADDETIKYAFINKSYLKG